MNLEEARKIIWIKTNPRPMGELLDNGFLTKDRLEWTVRKAYNPLLKETAQILLDFLESSPAPKAEQSENSRISTFQPGISLEKARSTLWPFSKYKGQPMGMLVESKQLSTKDLGYAIDNARDDRVKQAAIALMLVRLDQEVKEPVSSAGFLKVVSGGRSYAKQQETRYTLLQGMFLGATLVTFIAIMIWDFAIRVQNSNAKSFSDIVATPAGIIALVIVLAGMILFGWLINFMFDRTMKSLNDKIEQYRLGQEGEDNVVQSISQALDGNWNLFRNVRLYGRNRGDQDLVLVGPPGIWTLEVKNFNGAYRNIGDTWELRKGREWKKASVNPSRQANNNSLNLKNFLKADNINTYVNPVVVWANPESPLTVENPMVAVWQYARLPDELGNIWQSEKLSQLERDKIVEKLSKLCEKQKEMTSK